MMANQIGDVGIVFHDEKARFHGIIVTGKQLPDPSCRWAMGCREANFIGL
jgi:hypothetical protein